MSVGFTPIQGEKITEVMPTLVPQLRTHSRLITILFLKISSNSCLMLNSRFAQSVHIQQNKHCVFQKAVNPTAGLKSSPWECSLGWQCLFRLTVPLLRGKEQATSSVSPLFVNCGVS